MLSSKKRLATVSFGKLYDMREDIWEENPKHYILCVYFFVLRIADCERNGARFFLLEVFFLEEILLEALFFL